MSDQRTISHSKFTRSSVLPAPNYSQFSNLLQLKLSVPQREHFPMHHTHIFSHRPTGIHSLPVELLTRIFVLGTGYDYPYADSPFLLKPAQSSYIVPSTCFQVLISHVCQRWRQVALRTSFLWTTLYFREPSHILRAETYLARCSTSPIYLLDILVDTVADEDHIPGVTLCREEIRQVFRTIIPHVKHWRAFHLKVCDNECKMQARQNLSTCGPAPHLETLQLYHFENFRTEQNLYIATYRPPVVVFENCLPRLRNVSLIGVNLPWEKSPYLINLHNLELALHLDSVRPPYDFWYSMLSHSPELHTLALHYSGPRTANGQSHLAWPSSKDRVHLDTLRVLSLTDLDPDYLCLIMERLFMPGIRKLILDLPDQDFTPFIDLIIGSDGTQSVADDDSVLTDTSESLNNVTLVSPTISESSVLTLTTRPYPPMPNLSRLEVLVVKALECTLESWNSLLFSLEWLKVLEVDFSKAKDGFWKILAGEMPTNNDTRNGLHVIPPISIETKSENDHCAPSSGCNIVLPRLETFKTSGLSGKNMLSIIRCRREVLGKRCQIIRWIVQWNERIRQIDKMLNSFVEQGFCALENEGGGEAKRIIIEACEDEEEDVEDEPEESDDGEERMDESAEVVSTGGDEDEEDYEEDEEDDD